MEISFTIDEEPISMARTRTAFKAGKVWSYLPTKCADYKDIICAAAQVAWKGIPLTCDVSVVAKFYRNISPGCRKFGDIDNHLKILLDGLSGVIYADDSQVTMVAAQKIRDVKQRTEVTITTL